MTRINIYSQDRTSGPLWAIVEETQRGFVGTGEGALKAGAVAEDVFPESEFWIEIED